MHGGEVQWWTGVTLSHMQCRLVYIPHTTFSDMEAPGELFWATLATKVLGTIQRPAEILKKDAVLSANKWAFQ